MAEEENIEINSLINIWAHAMQIKNKEIAEIALEELLNEIELIEKKDWVDHQICGDFPKVDTRCLIYCCISAKSCPYRNAVLYKMGKTSEEYAELKKSLVQTSEFLNFVEERG